MPEGAAGILGQTGRVLGERRIERRRKNTLKGFGFRTYNTETKGSGAGVSIITWEDLLPGIGNFKKTKKGTGAYSRAGREGEEVLS